MTNRTLQKLLVLLIIVGASGLAHAQANECRDWQAGVDPRIESATPINVHDLIKGRSSANILIGFECLLKLEGRKHRSKEAQVTDWTLGVERPSPSVEVLALYAITALYYQNWQHSWAIVLTEGRTKNKPRTIRKAYRAYRSWLTKVEEIGLEEARRQNLNPLGESGVKWYFRS